MSHHLFRFGVIADIQYVNLDDGQDFTKTVQRRYRGALDTLDRAVDYWKASKVDFVAQLGDAIDGQCASMTNSNVDMAAVLSRFTRLPADVDVVHLIGNHELYNFDRSELSARLNTARAGGHADGVPREYYNFRRAGWRFLVLDPYRDAVIGVPKESGDFARGQKLLEAQNPNMVPSALAGGSKWFDGMKGEQRRFVPYNGGFGPEQLAWLGAQLAEAAAAGERVAIMSHVILHPKACHGSTMAWDYDAALEVLARAPAGVVGLVLCGHDHFGGYHLDEAGTHHVTFKSPLNRGAEGQCFGVVEVLEDAVVVRGPALADLLHDGCLASGEASAAADGGDEALRLPLMRRAGVNKGRL